MLCMHVTLRMYVCDVCFVCVCTQYVCMYVMYIMCVCYVCMHVCLSCYVCMYVITSCVSCVYVMYGMLGMQIDRFQNWSGRPKTQCPSYDFFRFRKSPMPESAIIGGSPHHVQAAETEGRNELGAGGMHKHIHAYMHTCIYASIAYHVYIYICVYTYIHRIRTYITYITYIHNIHTYLHTYIPTYITYITYIHT